MGRQSSRIWLANNTDHKEMVTWNGSSFQYHDEAYIWNGSTFELVWQKLYGLKLLYESELTIKPVSSENNKYLYFVEDDDNSVIYQISVNARNPEKVSCYTSETYDFFSAPVSSRGFGIYSKRRQSSCTFSYKILNFENGTVHTTGTFDASEYLLAPYIINMPTYTNQEVSPAESGGSHDYASILTNYTAIGQSWNHLYFIAPTGISAMQLDNREGTGTQLGGYAMFDIGRLNDGTARGLLPRFFCLNFDDTVSVLEYGAGVEFGYYSAEFTDTLPFSLMKGTGGGLVSTSVKVFRDNKLPILDNNQRIWLIKVNTDSFSYIDTGIDSPSAYVDFDVSPDYKYIMTFEDFVYSKGVKTVKIYNAKTKELEINLSETITDIEITKANFVGHKCLYIGGFINGTWHYKHRLYKWR